MVYRSSRHYFPLPDQLLIKGDGLVRDARPGEVPFHAFAAWLPHALAGGGVFEEYGKFRAQIAGELIGIHRESGTIAWRT
jgi:hypothetical protein